MIQNCLKNLIKSICFLIAAQGSTDAKNTCFILQTLFWKIEKKLNEELGYEVATFIRTDAELAEIAKHKPFPQANLDAAMALNIGFLAESLDESSIQKLMSLKTDIDDFIKEHNLGKVFLLGHSMGGKVAIKLVLKNPDLIKKLIIVDISPFTYENDSESIEIISSHVKILKNVEDRAKNHNFLHKFQFFSSKITLFFLQNFSKFFH